jgi:integrase
MAAKVIWYRNAWWVRTHHRRRKKDRRIGASKADKRQADEIARKVNAAIALGTFQIDEHVEKPLPCAGELRRWHATYTPTMKHSYEVSTRYLIERHLAPFFGTKDLRAIREADLLAFARRKLDEGLHPKTIGNALGVLRRVLYLAQREGLVARNPAARVGDLLRRLDGRLATEAREVEHWSPAEVEKLIALAREHEPRFAPALLFLFSTGCRRGEGLGLKWEDVDFERRAVTIRRAVTLRRVTTPKSGRGRTLALPHSLALELFDLLATRRRQALERGWPQPPEWVFCAEDGSSWWDERHFSRVWERLRRRAQREGIRPLKLHATRHTWATLALQAGKSVRWVADQLGHADPALTMRVYAHAMREEETDLSFAEFGSMRDGARRLYASPESDDPRSQSRKRPESLVGRQGLEPWTNGLKERNGGEQHRGLALPAPQGAA